MSFDLLNKTQEELVSVTKKILSDNKRQLGIYYTIHSFRRKERLRQGMERIDSHERHRLYTISTTHSGPKQLRRTFWGGGVIMTTARKFRIQSKLPHKLWPHLVAHSTRILNRIPVQGKDRKKSFEMVHGRQPDLSHLRIIGPRAYCRYTLSGPTEIGPGGNVTCTLL